MRGGEGTEQMERLVTFPLYVNVLEGYVKGKGTEG